MKDLGVTIIGLAVTDETDDVLLNQIVTSPDEDFFKVDAFSELEMEDFGMEIRDRVNLFSSGSCIIQMWR